MLARNQYTKRKVIKEAKGLDVDLGGGYIYLSMKIKEGRVDLNLPDLTIKYPFSCKPEIAFVPEVDVGNLRGKLKRAGYKNTIEIKKLKDRLDLFRTLRLFIHNDFNSKGPYSGTPTCFNYFNGDAGVFGGVYKMNLDEKGLKKLIKDFKDSVIPYKS